MELYPFRAINVLNKLQMQVLNLNICPFCHEKTIKKNCENVLQCSKCYKIFII